MQVKCFAYLGIWIRVFIYSTFSLNCENQSLYLVNQDLRLKLTNRTMATFVSPTENVSYWRILCSNCNDTPTWDIESDCKELASSLDRLLLIRTFLAFIVLSFWIAPAGDQLLTSIAFSLATLHDTLTKQPPSPPRTEEGTFYWLRLPNVIHSTYLASVYYQAGNLWLLCFIGILSTGDIVLKYVTHCGSNTEALSKFTRGWSLVYC